MGFFCSRGPATPDFAGDRKDEACPEGGERKPRISRIARINGTTACPREIIAEDDDSEVQ
jgi:hypothetical protein